MYDIAEYLTFIPLEITGEPQGDRFNNAGFEYKSLILNGADIFFLFMLSFISFMVYSTLKYFFARYTAVSDFFKRKVQMFSCGNFIELFDASFMIIYLCSFVNLESINASNYIELV
jgi:hypothetical protein